MNDLHDSSHLYSVDDEPYWHDQEPCNWLETVAAIILGVGMVYAVWEWLA